MSKSDTNIVQRRPAETGGTIGATVSLLLLAFGVDPTIAAAIAVAAGYAPAVITWIVTLVKS